MGNKVSKKKEKEEKPKKEHKKEVKPKIETNEKSVEEELKEKYIVLKLFSENEQKVLIQNFLFLSNKSLDDLSKDLSLSNEAIKYKIITEGEIEENKLSEYLNLPQKLEKFQKILFNSLKTIKYIKKNNNIYEQESDIQKYLNQYEGKNILNFEQYLFAIALYCMKFDEDILSNEKRDHCIFNSLKNKIEDTENENTKTNENNEKESSTNNLSNELDSLLGIENSNNVAKVQFSTIETIVMGMAWITKSHNITINKIKEKINKIEEEKQKEKEKKEKIEAEKSNKEKVDKQLIEKMNKKWKEHLNKDIPDEIVKSLSDVELNNEEKSNENKNEEKKKKKDFFDYRSIDNYNIDVEINQTEITIEEKYIKNALITALPQNIRKQSDEEQKKYLITWKEWNKWRSVRAPYIFRILAVYICNKFLSLISKDKSKYYLLKNVIKDYGVIANMDDLSKLKDNGLIDWELLYVFSWFMPNNSMGSHINMDILYQASVDGFSMNRFEKHVRLYPGSTVLFISGDLITNSSSNESQQILVGSYVQTSWKLSSSFWGNNQCIIFEMYPNFESCPGTRINNNYVLCNVKSGIGFGGKKGNHRLWVNDLLQKGGYQYDILVNELNTYKPSDNNFTQTFEINDIFVVGLGGREALDAQKKAWEFEKNESERRTNVNIRQANGTVDKQFLQMVGIIDQSAEDRGIERCQEKVENEE